MASIMIHLQAAHRLLQPGGLLCGKIIHPSNYYLGVIAPDSVNLDGFAEKEIRWSAHLRAKTPKEWYQNIGTFYQKQQDKSDHDLLLGYIIHNITDAAFDETLHNPIWTASSKADASPSKDVNDSGWEECYRYDFSQRNESWWTQEVMPALAQSKVEKINKLSASQIERWRDYLLKGYMDTLEKSAPKVITKEMVWLLGDYVEFICKKILTKKGNF